MIYWLILAVIMLIIFVGIGVIWFEADKEVKNAPREDMCECHAGKHGAYPKKYAIVSNDYGTEEPVLICPFCYENACKQALANEGLKKNSQTQI